MKLIATITDKEAIGKAIPKFKEYSIRKAGRAIVYNSDNKMAILHATKYNFHKLLGGGVEEGEDIKTALERELLEEIGCNVEIVMDVGSIIELKNEYGQKQTSYCYTAKVLKIGNSNLTEMEEQTLGIKVKWVSLNEAIKIFEEDSPEDYTAKFIRLRDLIFLKEVLHSLAS